MDIREVLGNNLKALRGDTPQATVAEACGFEIGSLSRWENGKAWASSETINSLATYYGVQPSELYLSRESKPSRLIAVENIKTSDVLKILTSRAGSIPDEVYEMAEKISLNDSAWEFVKQTLAAAVEIEAEKNGSPKKSSRA